MSGDGPLAACERFGHAWYTRKYGGVACGRCALYSSKFCMFQGKPYVGCATHPQKSNAPLDAVGQGR